jgi:hypothetical protein
MSNKTGKMPGVRVGGAVGLAATVAALAFGAGPAAADGTPTDPAVTTVVDTTTQPAVTTAPVTTTAAPTTTAAAPTTTVATATPAPTSTDTTASTPPTTTAAVTPTTATLSAAPRPAAGCPQAGAVGLVLPQRAALVLGPFRALSGASFSYPSDGSVVTATGLSVATCTEARPSAGIVQVRSLSLFGGVVTAESASLNLSGGGASVSGLRVGGQPVSLGKPIRLGNWGFLLAPDSAGSSRSAFEIELTQPRSGLPAGTIVFVPYAKIELAPTATVEGTPTTTEAATAPPVGTPPPHDEGFTRPMPGPEVSRPGSQPLTVTPPLLAGPYMFPVAGTPVWGDSYGGLRADVSGGWHHGDDIFASIGTPVVAVADGTINRVGWERLGGWRLWVRDRAGDQFYYAHLSAYSPLALDSMQVHRGDVIGFVGNTGDAFTTLPHLHFEVHPRSLLFLHYDGAVDPTSYLSSWAHPGVLHVPLPVRPRLPHAPMPLHEADQNWRELLAARGLTEHKLAVARGTVAAVSPAFPFALPVVVAPAVRAAPTGTLAWPLAAIALIAAALIAVSWRKRAIAFFFGK